jgi:hypothetical protein
MISRALPRMVRRLTISDAPPIRVESIDTMTERNSSLLILVATIQGPGF